MTAERWQRIEKLYHAAEELEPGERKAFLTGACQGDDELKHEIECLLAQDPGGKILDSPASALLAADVRPLSTGHKLGPYEIVSHLGAGGMGSVYKARDTRVGRTVAIKMPAGRFSERFEREARAIAALNHPHVCTLYDVGHQDGADYIVMEFVTGKTLDQAIPRRGMRLTEALKLAVQIADALAAAHAAGIVHRDLKPSNIMVDDHGQVKVLDFGLAKLAERAAGDESTQTERPQTDAGAILGTVSYMSPEQAEGKTVDTRSDIFSFGSVLYEMVSGRQAFASDSKISTLSAILREEPKPLASVPAELEKLIGRCLKKDRERRMQHIDDVKLELEALKEDSDSGRSPEGFVKPTGRRLPALTVLAVLILIAGVGITLWLKQPNLTDRHPVFTQITSQLGQEMHPSLSPDGKLLAYASRVSGRWDIYQQRVGGKNPVNLTNSSASDNVQPAFSPDGEQIAFRSERGGGGIFVMGATGEFVRRFTEFGYEPAWSPDGKEVVFATEGIVIPTSRYDRSQLWSVNLMTSQTRQITMAGIVEDAVQPNWSPHGHRIAYWAHLGGQRDIWTVSADGKHPVPVTHDAYLDWSPVWSPDGNYLYFSSDRGGSMNLWRVRIEEKSGKVLGQPEPITTPSVYSGPLSISRDGRRIAYVQGEPAYNIQKVALDPSTEKVVGEPAWITHGARRAVAVDASPDGEWLTFFEIGGQEDILVIKSDGTEQRQLTNDIHRDRAPRWSPDGSRIAFASNRSGTYDIWTIAPDGSGLRQLTNTGGRPTMYPVWSPDGTRLAYFGPNGSAYFLETAKDWKEQTPEPLPALGEDGQFQAWSWSSDGRWLAGSRNLGLGVKSGLFIYSLESRKFERLMDFGKSPVWLNDNRRLLFLHQDKLYLVDSQSKKAHEVFSVAPHSFDEKFALSRDNRVIFFGIVQTESDIWLMNLE